ncbi:hypothetical protein GWI33_000981, partial [Rhynchophorus ferrugineus]
MIEASVHWDFFVWTPQFRFRLKFSP